MLTPTAHRPGLRCLVCCWQYGFTYPPHQSSEYGRREMVGQFERLTAKLAQVRG